jgi:hypothetical protein
MYFHNWLKKQGGGTYNSYVLNSEVIKYVKGKDHPVAKQLLKECQASDDVKWVPIAVWEDEYYNFKS